MTMNFLDKAQLRMIHILKETIPFLVKNKLWKGFFNQKAVLYLTILLGLAIPITLFNFVDKKIEGTIKDGEAIEMGISGIPFSDLLSSFSGYHKYIVMILFSMLITFIMHKTMDVLTGYQGKITIKDFIDSQIRIIALSIRNWIYELVLGIVVSIVVGIFGPDWLEDVIKFFIGAFFVGYLFFDSYFHIYNLKIKEAKPKIHLHIPAVVILGTVVKLIFAIPFLGSIAGTIIGAIAATYYLHTSAETMHKPELV